MIKTKKYFFKELPIFLILLVFLIIGNVGIVNADSSFDNVKTFEKGDLEYGRYIIKDMFGLGGAIQIVELTKNDGLTCGYVCSAYFEVQNLKDDLPLFNDIRFLRTNDNKAVNINEFNIYYSDSEEEYNVEDYETQCEYKTYSNGTSGEVCKAIVIKTHKESKPIWKKYMIGQILPKGKYKVKVEGKKNPNLVVDWQIDLNTFFGTSWSDEWAVWGATTLGEGLVHYFPMDDNGGPGVIDVVGKQNGTKSASAEWVPGLIGYGINSTGGGGAMALNATINAATTLYTISFWVKDTAQPLAGDSYYYGGNAGDTELTKQAGDGYWYTLNTERIKTELQSGISYPGADKWVHVILITNATADYIYINGTLAANGTTTDGSNWNNLCFGAKADCNNANDLIGVIDELGIWNRSLTESEISQLYNSGAGLPFPASKVTLNYPPENYTTNINTITFNATASVYATLLSNMSLYHNASGNWELNETKIVNGTLNTSLFTQNFPEGRYKWTVEACSIDGVCFFGDNRTMNIDTANPTITIYSPVGSQGATIIPYNVTLNYTASDSNLDSCWYNSTWNSSINILTCNSLANITVSSSGSQIVYVYANDSAGNIGFSSSSFFLGLIINNISYNQTAIETSMESFSVNYSSYYSTILSSTAIFYYNGTSYPSSVSCDSIGCIATNNINIPLLPSSASLNYSFYWVITTFNGSSSETSTIDSYLQEVSTLNLTVCTEGTRTLNFTAWDEQNRTKIAPFLFDATFDYYTGSGSVNKTLIISNSSVLSELNLCINVNTTYYIDSIIAYSAPTNPAVYTIRNHFYQRYKINETMKNIYLYLLRTSASTSFVLSLLNEQSIVVPNLLIDVQKCFPGTDTIETVLIARTNNNGLSVANLEAENALYQFIITNQSRTVLAVTPCDKVVPQTSPYTLTFQLGGEYSSPWSDVLNTTDITQTLTYNKTSGFVILTYIDTSGNLSLAQLIVRKLNYTGSTAPIICNVTSNLSSGILTCNVTSAGSYSATAYYYRSPAKLFSQIVFAVETISSIFGYYGVFLGFIILLVCAFAFKFNEIAGIILLDIGMIFCNFVGIIRFGWISITSILLISIIIMVVLKR